jgi:hypothetical protein
MESTIGYLIVNVSTARGAIPLAGASVTVLDEDGEVCIVPADGAGEDQSTELSES